MRLHVVRLRLALALSPRADLVVISQGGNIDGALHAELVSRLKLAYVLIAQKATDLYWPLDHDRDRVHRAYSGAQWCFFVSEHNRRLTEEQIGFDLPRSSVVRNPFLTNAAAGSEWPGGAGGLRLACVGRLYPKEKGQDLLLRVLARPKWRKRELGLTFFGSGDQRQGLERMAAYLELDKVSFAGFIRDVDSIWRDHHALVMPSRCEGMPLVLVEAMMSGRVAIVTDVGGAREIVDDGRVGFVASAASENALDDALERAWQRRAEWPAIGDAAAMHIRSLVPTDPAGAFAEAIEQLVRDRDLAAEAARAVANVERAGRTD